ncbi:hypothetical protein Hamer_G010061 [Homarus americanus]|uniref:Uncharacterized protein n=1 Tax=Homarus americanus TaxID=6706 RepID=A0A8J5JKK6_HOMAM|nr:hypothetical protein Hamer_G010061 [Homarus americanus]
MNMLKSLKVTLVVKDFLQCQKTARHHPQFKYWSLVLELELTVLMFVRSLKSSNFKLCVDALVQLMPWFFALDRTHHSRWLSVHVHDMQELPVKHPQLTREFEAGKFTLPKTKHAFSTIPLDQSHEQNNEMVKGEGGATGLTGNPQALRRWKIEGPQIATLVNEFEEKTHLNAEEQLHEQVPSFQRCQNHGGSLHDFFAHENQAYPPISAGGRLQTSSKSHLLKCFEKLCEARTGEPDISAVVIGGAGVVQMLKPGRTKIFKEADCSRVDKFVSKGKKIFLKAPSRCDVFKKIAPQLALPPQPILTRWGTWISAVLYYASNLDKFQDILTSLDDKDSSAIHIVKELLQDRLLCNDLAFIASNYGNLPEAINTLGKSNMPLIDALKCFETIVADITQVSGEKGKSVSEKCERVIAANRDLKN